MNGRDKQKILIQLATHNTSYGLDLFYRYRIDDKIEIYTYPFGIIRNGSKLIMQHCSEYLNITKDEERIEWLQKKIELLDKPREETIRFVNESMKSPWSVVSNGKLEKMPKEDQKKMMTPSDIPIEEQIAFVNKRKAIQHAENRKQTQQKLKRKGYK